MPISPTTLAGAIKFNMKGVKFIGRDAGKLADAIGRAVYIHVTTPNMTTALITGTVGPVGSVTSMGVAGIVPTGMKSLMSAAGVGKGFKGRDLRKLAQAISLGLSQVLMTMIINGSAVGLAIGGGTSKFVGLNPKVLSTILKGQMLGVGYKGRDMMKLADMVSIGVVTHLMSSATFPITSVGVIAPIPPVGPLPIGGIPTVFSKIS